MRLRNISIKNLQRRKGRTLFLLIGLTVAVATYVSLTTITTLMKKDLSKKLDEFGANILITPKTEAFFLSYAGINLGTISDSESSLRSEDASKIKGIHLRENIYAVSPKVLGLAKVEKKNALLLGLRFDEELKIKKWWRIKGSIPKKRNEVILGSDVALSLSKIVGQTLKINGEVFEISGILNQTGSQDDNFIFIDLEVAQRILKRNNLSFIEVAAYCYSCPIEEIVKEISHLLPHAQVRAIKQTLETKMETLSYLKRFSIGISGILLFIAGLIVFSNMMASINERKREIGVFAAVGFRRGHILQLIFLEGLFLSLIGGIFGYFLGFEISFYLKPFILSKETVHFGFDPSIAITAVVLSVLVGTFSCLYPAINASKMDPTVALRAL